jgi:hypothetical protein
LIHPGLQKRQIRRQVLILNAGLLTVSRWIMSAIFFSSGGGAMAVEGMMDPKKTRKEKQRLNGPHLSRTKLISNHYGNS